MENIRVHGLPLESERAIWYRDALYLHADVLFTSDKGKDPLDGAALRALRDLGCQAQVELFRKALDTPATKSNQPLRAVIRRIRNEMIVHSNFRLDQMGSAMRFIGWGESDDYIVHAFNVLIRTCEQVLADIARIKQERLMTLPPEDLPRVLGHSTIERMRAMARDNEKRNRGDAGP